MLVSPGPAGEASGGGNPEGRALDVLVDSADATFVLGPRLEVVAAYRRRPARTGILGDDPFRAIHPDDLGGVLDVLARVRDRPRSAEPLALRAADEAGRWVDVHLVVANSGGTWGLVLQAHVLGRAAGGPAVALPTIAEIAPVGIAIDDDLGAPLYANAWLRRRLPGHDGRGVAHWLEVAVDHAAAETVVRNARAGLGSEADLWFDLLVGRRCLWTRVVPHRSATGDVAGVVSTFVDVTEVIEARRRLERSERLQATMLAGLAEGVLILDSDGDRILDANAAAYDLVRLPPGSLVGARVGDFTANVVDSSDTLPQRPDDHHVTRAVSERTAPTPLVVRYVLPDGELRWFSIMYGNVPAIGDDPARVVVTFTDVTAERERMQSLSRRASRDPLTGLPNRAAILEHLAGALARQRRRPGGLCAVLFCDLDGFKQINDSLGHQSGDRVLLVAADRIRTSCREADRVGRLGGDEFLVVLEDLHDPGEIRLVAERIVTALRQRISVGESAASLGISIGVAVDSGSGSAEELLSRADGAMYGAKQAGGSTWVDDG